MKLQIQSTTEIKIRVVLALVTGTAVVAGLSLAQSLGMDEISIAKLSAGLSAIAGILSLVYLFSKNGGEL